MERMHKIGFIIYPSVSPMTFAATSVFELANWKIGSSVYEIALLSEHGGAVKSSLGCEIQTSSFKRRKFDTLIVAGGTSVPSTMPGLLNYLRSAADRTRRVASICTAAFVLAEAGLLDGRRATTHWYHARELQRRFPKINVEADRIFTTDGPMWTSAGMSAELILRWHWWRKTLAPRSLGRSRCCSWCITVEPAVSRSIRRCWIWTHNQIVSRPP